MVIQMHTLNKIQGKRMSTSNLSKSVLFTTACAEQPYDYIATNIDDNKGSRLKFERHISYGLRFLKANIPGIEILEYPSW